MSTELMICPECGGIIGADEASDQGKPCTCFKTKGDTSVMGKAVSDVKVCWKCGKDVTGLKRARDSNGYWCYDCHKADKAKNAPQGVRCAECGRKVAETALIDFEGMLICTKCRDDHAELARHKKKFRAKVGDSAYQAHDRKRLFLMLGFVGVLVLIIVLRHLKLLPDMI
jgi:ribosomal protein L34E